MLTGTILSYTQNILLLADEIHCNNHSVISNFHFRHLKPLLFRFNGFLILSFFFVNTKLAVKCAAVALPFTWNTNDAVRYTVSIGDNNAERLYEWCRAPDHCR